MLAFTVEASLVTLRWRQERRGDSIGGQAGLRYRISWLLSNINSSFSGKWYLEPDGALALTSDTHLVLRGSWNRALCLKALLRIKNFEVSESCMTSKVASCVCRLCTAAIEQIYHLTESCRLAGGMYAVKNKLLQLLTWDCNLLNLCQVVPFF